jgi:hypothetical protein
MKGPMSNSHPIEDSLFIRELIRRVNKELLESQEERRQEGGAAIFQVEGLTIEVNFVAIDTKGGRGGLDFKVITVGGEKHYENQQVHKITLTLGALPYQDGDSRFEDLETGSHFMPRRE